MEGSGCGLPGHCARDPARLSHQVRFYLLIKMLLKTQPGSGGLGTRAALAHQGGTDEPTAQFSPPSATGGRGRAPELHACALSSGDRCASDEPRPQGPPEEPGVAGQARR